VIHIDVGKDFSPNVGARHYDDGIHSGQEFYDTLLKPKFQEAVDSDTFLLINFDSTSAIPSSFIDQAFNVCLKSDFGADLCSSKLIIKSNKCVRYIEKVMNIYK